MFTKCTSHCWTKNKNKIIKVVNVKRVDNKCITHDQKKSHTPISCFHLPNNNNSKKKKKNMFSDKPLFLY